MSRRAINRDPESFLGLDSFMDIVTNVIGALFFVVIYAAMSAFGAKGKVTTPMLSVSDTEAIFFECRGNTVLFPDVDKLLEESNEVWKQTEKDGISVRMRVEKLNEAKVGNSFYTFVLELKTFGNIIFDATETLVPVSGSRGENASEFQREDSSFRRELARLDPKKHHIFFMVRTDSFEVFHTARRVAIKQGFRVGWDPIEVDDPLRFGSGGVVPTGPQ